MCWQGNGGEAHETASEIKVKYSESTNPPLHVYFRPTLKNAWIGDLANIRSPGSRSRPPYKSHTSYAIFPCPSSPLASFVVVVRVPLAVRLWRSARSSAPLLLAAPLSLKALPAPSPLMQPAKPAEVVFSSDVRNMDDWARRTRIPLTTAEALGATYARAHRWLHSLRMQLIHEHSWADVPSTDSRILISLETSSIWRSSVGLPAGPKLKLQLPVHATSFFSPERRVQWQMVFHSDIFESVRKICPPINDILCIIQCLLTGVVTLVFEENLPQGIHRTTRGLPPVSWINANEASLTEIFGISHFKALRKACSDTAMAYKLEVVPHRR